ncbi:MAG TPA: hypothetical protein VMS17_22865 [Gemmataceae bacterium]|nr:hypothetical protein [Gemmataceae bacterium]
MQTVTNPRLPPLWLPLLLCAAAAAWIDLGNLHRGEHADALITTLTSLYRWTPYVWELDRGGNILALLAIPVRNPLANLLVQEGISAFCTLASFVLLARYVLRDASYPAVGLLGAAGFVALPSFYYRSEILLNTGYGLWIVLGLAALLLAESPATGRLGRHRYTVAAVLMIVAHWVWCTTAMFLGPVVLFRGLVCAVPSRPAPATSDPIGVRSRLLRLVRRIAFSETTAGLGLLAVGFAGGLLVRRLLAKTTASEFGTLPASQWLPTLGQLSRNTWFYLNPAVGPLFLAAVAAATLLWLAIPALRRLSGNAFRSAAALGLAGGLLALFLATRVHVQISACAFRYLALSVLFLQTGLLAVVVGPLCLAAGGMTRKGIGAAAAVLLAVAAVVGFGVPSLAGVRADLAVRHLPKPARHGLLATFEPGPGMSADDIVVAGCTHVAGDYWQVWPAVFEANMKIADQRGRRVVWGVTNRSSPTRRYWRRTPPEQMRVAVPPGDDPKAAAYLAAYGFPPLVVVEKRPTIWVMRPKSVVQP